jgi:hypothetical protein
MTPLLLLAAVAALALVARQAVRARRAEAGLQARLAELSERLDRLQGRLDTAEQDLALALSRTGVAEGLLLEKGIADAEEVEDMRRRLGTDGGAPGDGDAVH